MISSNYIDFSWWLSGLLLTLSLKVLLLAVFVWVGLAIGRVQSATWRHRVWLLCLVAMLVMPLLALLAPAIPVPGLQSLAWTALPNTPFVLESDPATPSITTTQVQAQRKFAPFTDPASEFLPKLTDSVPLQPSSYLREVKQSGNSLTHSVKHQTRMLTHSSSPSGFDLLVVIITTIYLAGSVALALRLVFSLGYCLRLVRRSKPVKLPDEVMHLSSKAQVVQSGEVTVPLCQGIVRSTIILPEDWISWDRSLLTMVLSHEAEHIRRYDPLVSFLAAMGTIFYWFHPVSWKLQRTLSDLAEHACDDAVIGKSGERNGYARILLEMSRRVAPAGRRYQQLGVSMARKSEIEDRIERVIDTSRALSQRIGVKASTILLLLIAALSLVTAGLTIASTSQVLAEEKLTSNDASQKVTGSVVTPVGQPAKNAEVRLMTYDKSKSNYDHRTTRTNDQGKFQFDKVSQGNHRIAAYWKNMASRQQRYKGQLVNPGNPVELKLAPAPTLDVQVLKESDGLPVPDARIHFPWIDLQRDHATNAAGTAVINGLTPEEWTFEVLAKGYGKETQTIKLTGEDTTRVTVKLKPGFALYGTVRDEAGNPVPGAGISARVAGARTNGSGGFMKTDAEGNYRLESLPLRGLSLSIRKDGYDMISRNVDTIPRPMGERKFDITLPKRKPGGSIRGRITDSNGNPIGGVKLLNVGRSSDQTRKTTTDAEGKYQLDDLYHSFRRFRVFVQADGFAPQKLQVTPGSEASPATYDITMKPGRIITGNVLDLSGKPLSGVSVSYAGPEGHELNMRRATKTDAQGAFTLNSLTKVAPLTFVLSGYSTISDWNFPIGQKKPIVVTMKSEGIIRGKVVDDRTGKPVTDFKVQVTFSPERKPNDPQGTLSGARVIGGERIVNAEGAFELRKFVQGMPLQVTIRSEGYQKGVHVRVLATAESKAKVEEYRLTPVDPSMLRTFAGKVVDADGKAVPGVQMRLIATSARSSGERNEFPFNWTMIQTGQIKSVAQVSQFMAATTDSKGHFQFDKVTASPDIELVYWGGGVAQGRLYGLERFDNKQRMNIVVKRPLTGSLRGQINRKRFKSISRIMLSGEGTTNTATLSADGKTYEFKGISPGNYQIHLFGTEHNRVIGGKTHRTRDIVFRVPTKIRAGEQQTVNLGMDVPPPIKVGSEAMSEVPTPTPPPLAGQSVPKDQIRLAGQVMTPAGKGIPGAKLWLPYIDHNNYNYIETQADDQGRFSILVPRKVIADDKTHYIGTLWSYTPGRQIGSANVSKQIRETSHDPVGIVLGQATKTAFVVKDTDGKPISGVRVNPWLYKTKRANYIIPEPIRQLVGGMTDDQGNIMLPACDRQRLQIVLSTGEGFGKQQTRIPRSDQFLPLESIVLEPTGRVQGTLTAQTPVDFTGVNVFVDSESRRIFSSKGIANLTTDASGKFSIPELAEGRYRVYARFPDDKVKLGAIIPDTIQVVAGKTTRLTIPFKPTITAKGVIQTKDEKTPIAGALLLVSQGGRLSHQRVSSDKNGIYIAQLLPGESVRIQLFSKPREYSEWTKLGGIFETDEIPVDATAFQLPSIELVPTFPQEGKLIDAYDRPVEGATVLAISSNRVYSRAASDAKGKFTLRFPKGFQAEYYEIVNNRPPDHVLAKVVSKSPLVLQLP